MINPKDGKLNEKTFKKIVVDIYCRVSTDDQEDNTSLDEQERVCRQFCEENGFIVGMVHKEVWSGYQYRERKKLELMRQRYRDGKIQGSVIRTLDRLSRAQSHVAILLEEMEHHKATLYSVKEVIDETPMGKFARMVLAFVAEMEREKILDRTMTGRVNKIKEGNVPSMVGGPNIRYGWKWHLNEEGEKDYIELHEEQSAILRQAGQEYADGISFYQIEARLNREGVLSPSGKPGKWCISEIRRLLTDPRMIGKNVKAFTTHKKGAKQLLDPIDLPDGTYPAILSEVVYAKILERVKNTAKEAPRNAKYPEKYLLRAGFARCAHCGHTMHGITRFNRRGELIFYYICSNSRRCKQFIVLSEKVDLAVWNAVAQLADHVALLEESIELAMKNHSVTDDLLAVEGALQQARGQIVNYEEDLKDNNLRGDTRAGIRHLLNNANALVEDLEAQRAELELFAIDREKERVEFENILEWCKKVKSEREELTYIKKRDFLRLLGATVFINRQLQPGSEPVWDIRVALPAIQEVIYQGSYNTIGKDTCSSVPCILNCTATTSTRQDRSKPTC